MTQIRLALLDSDDVILFGKQLLIESSEEIQLVYQETVAATAIEALPELLVDVVVIDQRMRGMDGMETARQIIKRYLSRSEAVPKIVMTSPYFSDELQVSALRVGITELVTHDGSSGDLLQAIRNAIDPERLNLPGLQRYLANAKVVPQKDSLFESRVARLNPEEQFTFDLVKAASTVAQFRQKLGADFQVSLSNLLFKFDCCAVEQLFLMVREND